MDIQKCLSMILMAMRGLMALAIRERFWLTQSKLFKKIPQYQNLKLS